MANVSSATGHIYFSDQFWAEHWRDIAKFVVSYQRAVYGVTEMDMEETKGPLSNVLSGYLDGSSELHKILMDLDDPSLSAPSNDGFYFYGDGRWAFNSSLENFGGIPVPARENGMLIDPKDSRYEHNEAFLKLMAENNESFEIDFEDYEPGCLYRYDGRYRITPQWSTSEGITFVAEEIECREVGTDDRSLIKDDFEGGFYVEALLDKELFIEAAKELGLTPKQFADTLTAMPSYKGGICGFRLDTGFEDIDLEHANFEDVIRDVRDYLEKQQGMTT